MKINVAEGRQIEHPLRDNAAVADDDDGFGFKRGKLAAEFFVIFYLVGLRDRNFQAKRGLFYGRRNEFKTATLGAVRLRNDEAYTKSCARQTFERGNSKKWRTAEDEIEH